MGKNKIILPTDEELYEFCKDSYYCDPDDETGEREKWQPFELLADEQIETYIENDVYALKEFLEGRYTPVNLRKK